jgi:DNA-binding MarR family transcriptional regulator
MVSKAKFVMANAPLSKSLDAVDTTMKAWESAFGDADLQPFEIALRLRRLGLIAAMQIEILLRPLKIAAGDADVLARLYESGPPYDLTPGQLTTQCFVTTGAMTGRIDRLERAKVVVRVKSESDRRSHHVKLTKNGLDLAKFICGKIIDNAFSEGVRSLPSADKNKLLLIMRDMERRVLRLLENRNAAGTKLIAVSRGGK